MSRSWVLPIREVDPDEYPGCLDTPSGGTYTLNGKEVSRMTEDELAEIRNKEIGFIFQTFNLIPRSNALDNRASVGLCGHQQR